MHKEKISITTHMKTQRLFRFILISILLKIIKAYLILRNNYILMGGAKSSCILHKMHNNNFNKLNNYTTY